MGKRNAAKYQGGGVHPIGYEYLWVIEWIRGCLHLMSYTKGGDKTIFRNILSNFSMY